MEYADPPPVSKSHDSAVLPAKEGLLSRSVDQIEQVAAAHKDPSGTRLTEFDIFRHAITDHDRTVLTEKLRALHSHEHTTPFSTPPLDIEYLAQECLSWIVNEDVPHYETNFVSQLTSQALAQALEGGLDRETISTFQDFVLATTLTYTAWRDHRSTSQRLSVRDLHRVSCLAGSALLQKLDQRIDPEALGKAPRATLLALFLVVFGTTLGVTYSTPVGGWPTAASADQNGKVLTESPTVSIAVKERLCHALADKLALLAGLLWEKIDTATTRGHVLDGCLTGRWNRSGRWVWGNLMPHYTWPQSDHSLDWLVHRPGGAFQPVPRVAMMQLPEISSPLMPGIDFSDRGKRRSMFVVGPTSHGQHMYARMRTHTGSDGPFLFV